MGLTGSYETPRIAQAEVRKKCANSILVRVQAGGASIFGILLYDQIQTTWHIEGLQLGRAGL